MQGGACSQIGRQGDYCQERQRSYKLCSLRRFQREVMRRNRNQLLRLPQNAGAGEVVQEAQRVHSHVYLLCELR